MQQTLSKNEVIFREGDYQRWMYDIVKGSVEIYANYGQDNQALLVTLQAGQYFGEIGLTDMVPRTATAVAAEDDTQLAMITEQNLCEYFHDNPAALLAIMSNMSGRIRSLTTDYMNACQAIAEARESARKGSAKSSGLKAKLSKLVQDFVKPVFMAPSASFDIDAYMVGCHTDENGMRTLRANEIVFREGDASDCMYDIRLGSVGIYVNYGKADEKLLVKLVSEQFFGEMGMIDNLPRSATAVALENNTKVQRITAADFSAYMQEKPAKVLMIMQNLSSRLRELSKDYLDACRAVSEAESTESAGDQTGWLKDSMKRFMDDYNEAMAIIAEHPEMMTGSGYTPYHL